MRSLSLLALAAATSAFIIPDQQTLDALSLEEQPSSFWDTVHDAEHFWEDVEDRFKEAAEFAKHKFEDAIEHTTHTAVKYGDGCEHAFAGEAWLDTADYELDLVDKPPPHHGPPHDGPPHHGPPHDDPPHHGPPGRGPPGKRPGKKPGKRPHHPPHHGPANMSVYELIAKSKYTTKLAKIIDGFPDLVDLLNGTKANYTLFAPTDEAFKKIPKHAGKPPKELLKKLLTYHVTPEFYPAGRVFASRTIPTALEAEYIGKVPQRLSTQVGLRGLTLNYYSRIVAVDIFGTNGVIHGIDSLLLPPPKVATIINALPGEFSTLELALVKTGLFSKINDTSTHSGGTLFAPSNFAFKRLGPRINAFLFSSHGEKYLKALLLYHTVKNITLYSDAIYKESSIEEVPYDRPPHDGPPHHGPPHRGPPHHGPPHDGPPHDGPPHRGPPMGFFHIDLPTELDGKSLSIDVARHGRFITMKINAFNVVAVLDGIAADGVIHVVPNILIPPKTPGGPGVAADDMSLEEFKERLTPFVEGAEEYNDEMEL